MQRSGVRSPSAPPFRHLKTRRAAPRKPRRGCVSLRRAPSALLVRNYAARVDPKGDASAARSADCSELVLCLRGLGLRGLGLRGLDADVWSTPGQPGLMVDGHAFTLRASQPSAARHGARSFRIVGATGFGLRAAPHVPCPLAQPTHEARNDSTSALRPIRTTPSPASIWVDGDGRTMVLPSVRSMATNKNAPPAWRENAARGYRSDAPPRSRR